MHQSEHERNKTAIDKQANTCHLEVMNLYADLALDEGDEELAEAYRYMGREGLWPLRNNRGRYSWGTRGSRYTTWGLHYRVIQIARGEGSLLKEYYTVSAATHVAAIYIKKWMAELKAEAKEKAEQSK